MILKSCFRESAEDGKDVFLVMRPQRDTSEVVHVLLDGSLVTGKNAGKDVSDGAVTVETDRLYHLIELQESGRHTLELQFSEGGVELYAFTFG